MVGVDHVLMQVMGDRIQTWALEEARRRLEAEGIIEDSTKKQKSILRTVSGHFPPKH